MAAMAGAPVGGDEGGGVGGADGEREEVHLAVVEGRLLGAVVVVLVGGGGLGGARRKGLRTAPAPLAALAAGWGWRSAGRGWRCS